MELGRPILPPISSIDHYPQQQQQEQHQLRPSTWSAPLEPRAIPTTAMMSTTNKLPFFDHQSRRLLPPQPKLAPSPYPHPHENPRTVAARKRMQQDMDQVVSYCTNMRETIQQHQSTIDMMPQQPWLEDMIGQANEILNALLRLQKQQLAAQEEKRQTLSYHTAPTQTYASTNGTGATRAGFYGRMPHEDDVLQYDDPSADRMSVGAMAGGRLRRKRRRPVFQGRCHSCNISETPEWRRGPDGARTLCNACGLHYAKLERKRQAAEAKAKAANEDHDTAVQAFEPCPISSPTTSSTSSSIQDESIMTP